MIRLSRALTAILTATALALAGCSGSGSSGEFTAVDPTGASDTARDADGEDTGGEEKCEVDNAGNEGETEVDPSQFEAYGGYIVAARRRRRGIRFRRYRSDRLPVGRARTLSPPPPLRSRRI